jgi:uncharacterized protein DUF6602
MPGRFGVTTGEAVDSRERRSGQLDVVIYDRNLTAPLLAEDSGDLLPAESLLAVIEVKSTLTKSEMEKCATAAKKMSLLRPYGSAFVASRRAGLPASDGLHRCQYSVVAFESDLAESRWAEAEWNRLKSAASSANVEPERIDRVLVLNRGMLVPPTATATVAGASGKTMLREWFLHMSNFVVREAARRPDFDFQGYGRRKWSSRWTRLT